MTCHACGASDGSLREAMMFRESRARVPPDAGVVRGCELGGFVIVACVDTDVSFTIENSGAEPRLVKFGYTYVRGYDGYTVTVSVVVRRADEAS